MNLDEENELSLKSKHYRSYMTIIICINKHGFHKLITP